MVDGRLEIGVGRHDRAARAELGRDARPGSGPGGGGGGGDRTAPRRGADASRQHPGPVPVAAVRGVRPIRPWPGPPSSIRWRPHCRRRTSPTTAPCPGSAWRRTEDRSSWSAARGWIPDVIPTAADSRAQYRPDADLVVVVPEGDDHPLTAALAAALARPATLRTVSRGWEALAPPPSPLPSPARASPHALLLPCPVSLPAPSPPSPPSANT